MKPPEQNFNDALAGQFDRLPPHSVESEMCAIGSMMLDEKGAVREEILAMLTPSDFFQADHSLIFTVLGEMHRTGTAVDAMTLRTELDKRGLLEEIGGIAYLAQILTSVPSAANGVQYARRVEETARWRELISIGNEILRDAYTPYRGAGWEQAANKVIASLTDVLNRGGGDGVEHVSKIVSDAIELMDDVAASLIPTGVSQVDELIGGLKPGRTHVFAGRPGMGKSQWGKQLALNISRRKVGVGIVSIEEDDAKIAANFLSNAGNVPNYFTSHGRRLNTDPPPGDMVGEMIRAATDLSNLPLYIDDTACTLNNVESTITRMATKYGCKVVVVDYLQLINPSESGDDTRESQVRLMSNTLKRVFKRLKVAGVLLAQLNRAAGRERPAIHNLRESGAIEQDGDLIGLLYREDYYKEQEPGFQAGMRDHRLEINFAKHKDGPTGICVCYFDGKYQRITDHPDATDCF